MLKLKKIWRIHSPGPIEESAMDAFFNLVGKLSNQGTRWSKLELFKRRFAGAANISYYKSSSENWAESDLRSYMRDAAQNAPLFIEAFHSACLDIQSESEDNYAPDAYEINKFLAEQKVPYQIQSTELIYTGIQHSVVPPTSIPSFEDEAQELIRKSFHQSDQFLAEGHPRQAVTEMLWLLETVSTAFQGVDFETGSVQGKYFNKIADDLRRYNRGKVIEQVLAWLSSLHGYLSSPTGGGVRHGTHLKDGIQIQLNEGRLFCNLIRSYIIYLLEEHAQIGKR